MDAPDAPTFDPRLLIAVWLCAFQRGIGSKREIERMCQSGPAMPWLTGLDTIHHHSLSEFRVGQDEALKGLFQQVLGMLLLAASASIWKRLASPSRKWTILAPIPIVGKARHSEPRKSVLPTNSPPLWRRLASFRLAATARIRKARG